MATRKLTVATGFSADAPLELRPPSGSFFQEGLGLLEIPRLLFQIPRLSTEPRGKGEPVLVFPGFGAGDYSTFPLRRYLTSLGYGARGWGLGVNRGDVASLIPRITQLVRDCAAQSAQAVRLVGWSLGGVLAREAAREHPECVARVVTLGSPVVGGPKYTTAGRFYTKQGYDLDAIEASVAERNRIPIRVPITAIYSQADAVVAWQACIDQLSDDVEHVEVRSTHVGLGLSPEVYRIIAQRLARRNADSARSSRGAGHSKSSRRTRGQR